MQLKQVKESTECDFTHVFLVWLLPKQRIEDIFLLYQHQELFQVVFPLFAFLGLWLENGEQ